MLSSLHLRGAPAFDAIRGAMIGPLKPVNFVFGPNGSGKTTISRAFADPATFPGSSLSWGSPGQTLDIKVYNRDYVAETLRQAAHLPGVFLLGKSSQEVLDEIDALSGPKGSIASGRTRITTLSESLTAKDGEISSSREALKEAAWSKTAEVPAELSTMFTGYKNSKEKFLSHLIEVFEANPSTEDEFSDLTKEAAAVFADDASPVQPLPAAPPLDLEKIKGFDLFAIPVIGSADVRLSDLIQRLGNADWVEHGRHYVPDSDGACPFCQQKTPTDLAEQLDKYFDTRYTEHLDRLKAFRLEVQAWATSLSAYLDLLPDRNGASSHLDETALNTARAQLRAEIEILMRQIDNKLAGPSNVVALDAPAKGIALIDAAIQNANASIDTFNSRLKNRATARAALLKRCWVVFARKSLATQVGRFEGEMPPLLKAKNGIQSALDAANADLTAKRTRLSALQNQVTSSKPVIEKINKLLASVGFHSFRLRESSTVKDGYSLERENGTIASDSLSEGERTFITFLYFAQALQGTPQSPGATNDLLAVIDDPISSLDSDVLYAVSTLIRRIVADISESKGRVRQLVLLTHNAHFHKEVTYKRQGDKDAGWQYGVVRKRQGHPSELVLSAENPIQTAYAALWQEVRRSAADPHGPAAGLQNILRRILETYFKVLGGVDDTAIVAKFSGDDSQICRSLFSWVNAGSHSIFDDLDYTESPSTIESNLRVFHQIFIETDQEGHYSMMMREDTTTSAAAQ